MNEANTELAKAVEQLEIDARYNDTLNTAQVMLVIAAANRLKEVEKENEALTISVQQRQDISDTLRVEYKKALDEISDIKPPKDCPWCRDSEPCSHCMELARMQGRLAHLLSTPHAIAAMKGETE